MIKLQTVGMLNTAKGDPTVIAGSSLKNGYFHTISDGKTFAPVAGDSSAKQTDGIRVALNTITGDSVYNPDATIASAAYVNSFLLKAWEGQNLIVTDDHIDYGESVNYASITAGTTMLVANASGNLEIVADASYYGVHLLVEKKITFNGDAVLCKVVVG